MNVTIQGVTVAYYPDYSPTSKLWKVHLRDAFRIVTLAGNECFVKRFASKPRAWAFMVESKGKRQTGLPVIYEAKSAVEDGKRVYYLILEKIEGDTLHDLMKSKTGGKASVSLMGRALATAFRTVHAQGYWHADFCAKNIMVSASGRRFVMIDLDSLEPIATRPTPTPNEPGYLPDQELAIYALTYVQSYVAADTKSFGAISGSALNLLQLVFLLDKLVYFSEVLKPKGTKFRDLTAFKELPHLVHQHLGAYTDHLFKRILAQSADSEMIITQPTFFQKELLPPGQTIEWAAPSVPSPQPSLTASVPAELVYFKASRHAVLPTQSTQLIWKVIGVSSVEITGLGTRPAEGSFIIAHSNALVGEQLYTLTAAGGNVKGMVKVDFYIPPPLTEPSLPIAAIGFFTANRYAVKAGESTRLSWSVTGVTQVHITNIGTVPAVGSHTFAAQSFIGRVEFLLTTNSTAVKKSIFVDFSPKPIVPAPATWPVVPKQSAPVSSTAPSSSTAAKPTVSPTAAKPPSVTGARSSSASASATLAAQTHIATAPPIKKSSSGGMWVAILGICLLIAGWAWSSSWKSFTPNQLRGLQQFDKKQYDSSFVNLIEFRDDTSHRFATQYNLAYMYDKGKGAIANDRLAFELYSDCLKSSTPEVVSKSLYALGWCYLLGKGCARDTALAINNFGFAASRFKNLQAAVEYERLRKEAAPAVSEPTTQKTEALIVPAALSHSSSIESVAADPTVARITADAEETVIKRVVQLNNCTRVDFVCTKRKDSHIYLPAPGQPEAPYIEWADLRYKLIRTSGIGNAYGVTYARAGKPRYFSAFFEKIPSGATEISIRDGGDGAWAFYGIKLSFEAWK